jgi:hypothetical protein
LFRPKVVLVDRAHRKEERHAFHTDRARTEERHKNFIRDRSVTHNVLKLTNGANASIIRIEAWALHDSSLFHPPQNPLTPPPTHTHTYTHTHTLPPSLPLSLAEHTRGVERGHACGEILQAYLTHYFFIALVQITVLPQYCRCR